MNDIAKHFAKKNVLVVGGAGFIGSHFCEKIITMANKVICVDNYLSGSVHNHVKGVEYLKIDANNLTVDNFSCKFDFIFHFGEYSRVEQSRLEPYLALKNIYSTLPNILEIWRQHDAKLIYSGSSTKFTKNIENSHLSPYTKAKAANTELIVQFSSWYDLDFSIVYFYNVYGGREISSGPYSTAIAKFKELVKNGATSLPVTLPGTQRRNFTHVSDIVDGILLATTEGSGDGYCIGAEEDFSIIELCELFDCTPAFMPENPANRQQSPLLTQKIKGLGWTQKMNLLDHIKQFKEGLDI
jgi:UDP-glucose 4-epimerase